MTADQARRHADTLAAIASLDAARAFLVRQLEAIEAAARAATEEG
jgi:hypothetical protein